MRNHNTSRSPRRCRVCRIGLSHRDCFANCVWHHQQCVSPYTPTQFLVDHYRLCRETNIAQDTASCCYCPCAGQATTNICLNGFQISLTSIRFPHYFMSTMNPRDQTNFISTTQLLTDRYIKQYGCSTDYINSVSGISKQAMQRAISNDDALDITTYDHVQGPLIINGYDSIPPHMVQLKQAYRALLPHHKTYQSLASTLKAEALLWSTPPPLSALSFLGVDNAASVYLLCEFHSKDLPTGLHQSKYTIINLSKVLPPQHCDPWTIFDQWMLANPRHIVIGSRRPPRPINTPIVFVRNDGGIDAANQQFRHYCDHYAICITDTIPKAVFQANVIIDNALDATHCSTDIN